MIMCVCACALNFLRQEISVFINCFGVKKIPPIGHRDACESNANQLQKQQQQQNELDIPKVAGFMFN